MKCERADIEIMAVACDLDVRDTNESKWVLVGYKLGLRSSYHNHALNSGHPVLPRLVAFCPEDMRLNHAKQ